MGDRRRLFGESEKDGEEAKTGPRPFWDPILVGELTTQFRTYFSWEWLMFTGGTIWILTHGQLGPVETGPTPVLGLEGAEKPLSRMFYCVTAVLV